MKHLPILSLFMVIALLLSSCGVHTGLGKILGLGSSSSATSSTPGAKTTSTKHAKATHTPPAGGSSQGSDSIALTSSGFQPATLTVKVGTIVTWMNKDTTSQSVTSDTANLFESGSLNPGATYKYTFVQAGTFAYHSANTSTDTGTIVVTP